MRKHKLLLSLFLALLSISTLVGCNKKEEPTNNNEVVDYVDQCKFNPNSGRKYATATVKTYVDGDTTHFIVHDSTFIDNTLKARYLGIDTPESTGKIQPYGKKASKFTKEKLMSAESIIVESDSTGWNPDTTGGRYLVWVWYRTSSTSDYRLLNLELLQNGLTATKNYSNLTYATYFSDACSQAMRQNLGCLGNLKDPDFWYEGAQEITLKELRINPSEYDQSKVRFECTVGKIIVTSSYTVYVYDYDEETDITYGFQVFLGFQPMSAFVEGNRISLCAYVTYYETGHVYQLSSISEALFKPTSSDTYSIHTYRVTQPFGSYAVGDLLSEKEYEAITDNSIKFDYAMSYVCTSPVLDYVEGDFISIDEFGELSAEQQSKFDEYYELRSDYLEYVYEEPSYALVDGVDLNGNTKITINLVGQDDEVIPTEFSKPQIMLHSLVRAENLTVTKVNITKTQSSYGAATMTCTDSNGKKVVVRTTQFRDAEGNIIDLSTYKNKVISVKGVLDYYSNDDEDIDPTGYQIKVSEFSNLSIVG